MWVRMSLFLTPAMLVVAAIGIVPLIFDRLLSPPLAPASPHYDEAVSVDLPAGQAGVLAHESGARIEVPAGAATEAAAVSIREVPLPPSPLEVGRAFDFSLANGRFAEPATIRIPFDLDQGVDASEVVPLRWEADENAWSELSGEIDAPAQTVAVTTSEGGLFSTVARRTLESARSDPPSAPAASSPLLEHNMLWENTKIGTAPTTSAVVSDGVVYFGTCAGAGGGIGLYAFDMATGGLRWRQGWGSQIHDCARSKPVVSDGIVYVVSSCEDCKVAWDGDVYTTGDVSALDASTGELLWRYERGARDDTSWPVVSDGRVYLSSTGGGVTALDGITGTILWEYTAANAGLFLAPSIDEPIVSGGVVYFSGNSGLYALNATTGRLLWRYKVEDGGSSSELVVSHGVVYAGFYDGYTYALDAGTGDLLWRSETGFLWQPWTDDIRRSLGTSPVVSGGVVYTGSVDYSHSTTRSHGQVSALAASTGELLWQYKVRGSLEFSPIVSRGVVYAASRSSNSSRGGYVYALDAVTGTLLWQHDTHSARVSSALVVSGNIVYVGMQSSLYALDAETGDLQWDFKPRFRDRVVGMAANSPFGDLVFFVPEKIWTNRIVAIAVKRTPEVLE